MKPITLQFELGLLHPEFREHCNNLHSDYIAARSAVNRSVLFNNSATLGEYLTLDQIGYANRLNFTDKTLAAAAVQMQHRYIDEREKLTSLYYDVSDKNILFATQDKQLENRIKFFNSKCEEFLAANKKTAYVRIGLQLFCRLRENSFSYTEFAVLCGINSILGKKTYAWITLARIHAAAHGYSCSKLFAEHLQTNKELQKWTQHTTRRIVEKLVQLNFLAKITLNKRITYYSTELRGKKQLLAAIAKKGEKKEIAKNKTRIESNTLDTHLATFGAIVRGRSNIAEQLTLDLYNGEQLYSMKYFAAKNVPSADLTNILRAATVVTIQGFEFYSVTNRTADEVLELFNETQRRKIEGLNQKERETANRLLRSYRKK